MMTSLLSPEMTTGGTSADRCDRCGAAAKLAIVLAGGGELAFCGHHANKHAAGIAGVASRITVEDGFDWAGPTSPV
jgi:hypothetical protein